MPQKIKMSYGKYVHKPKGNRYAITDIHGCDKTLKSLLKRISLRPEDQLFFLGDFIDRGPSSSNVLNQVISLMNDGFQIYPLRGNHEQMLLDIASGSQDDLWDYSLHYNIRDLISRKKIKKKYKDFFLDLPFYYQLEDFILVHGGLNFLANGPLQDYHSMLWIRDFPVDIKWLKAKKIVHGHNPKPLIEIQQAIADDKPVIPIDNGCVLGDRFINMGNLLCLNLDNLELMIEPNCETLK